MFQKHLRYTTKLMGLYLTTFIVFTFLCVDCES